MITPEQYTRLLAGIATVQQVLDASPPDQYPKMRRRLEIWKLEVEEYEHSTEESK